MKFPRLRAFACVSSLLALDALGARPILAPPALAQPAPASPAVGSDAARSLAQALCHHAQVSLDQGDAKTAISLLRQALDTYPRYPLAHHELGIALATLGDLPKAATHFQAALDLAPDFARAYQALGEVRRRQDNLHAALSALLRATTLAPSDPEALYSLALTYQAQKRPADAAATFQALITRAAAPNAPRTADARDALSRLKAAGFTPPPDTLLATARAPGSPAPNSDTPTPGSPTPTPGSPTPTPASPTPTPGSPSPTPGSSTPTPASPTPGTPASPLPPAPPYPATAHAGDAYFAQQRFLDAAQAYERQWTRATRDGSAPDAALAYKIGATWAALNDPTKTLLWWERAAAADPMRPFIARQLALLRARLPAPAPPAPPLTRDPGGALLRAETAGPAWLAAEARLRLGDLDGAQERFEALLTEDLSDRLAQGGLAEVLVRLGRRSLATSAISLWYATPTAPLSSEAFLILRQAEVEAAAHALPATR